MPIRANDSDSFPGANVYAAVPLTKVQCCLLRTAREIQGAVLTAGYASTIRGGRCYVEASLEEVAVLCVGPLPEITDVQPDPINELLPCVATGINFVGQEGELWLADADTWAGSEVKVKQPVTDWTAVAVTFTPTRDGLPGPPAKVYVYVKNCCEQRNAVGYEVETLFPPD